MGCCMSVLTGANGWTSVAPQIDKTPSANTGENVEDLENALDTLRTENEALKREITNCINVLCVMDNFLQCNNITVEDLIIRVIKLNPAQLLSGILLLRRRFPFGIPFELINQSRNPLELLNLDMKPDCYAIS